MYYKQTNVTAVRSQNLMVDALFSLMKHKKFSEITVTEICEKASVGRKTFYRNFELKEDLIEFHLDKLYIELEQKLKNLNSEQQLMNYLKFIKKHSNIFIILYHNGFHDMVFDKFLPLLPHTMPTWSDDPVKQQYLSEYTIAGNSAVLKVWIERNYKESVHEIIDIIYNTHERFVERP